MSTPNKSGLSDAIPRHKKRKLLLDQKDIQSVTVEMHEPVAKSPVRPVRYTFIVDERECEEIWIPNGFKAVDTKTKNSLTVNFPIAVTFIRAGCEVGYDIQEAPTARSTTKSEMSEFDISYKLLHAFYLFEHAQNIMRDRWIINATDSEIDEIEECDRNVPMFTQTTTRPVSDI